MSTMMTLNKTMTLPILPEDDQTEYVTLTQGTAMMILLHKTCVNICRVSNNMYPPLPHTLPPPSLRTLTGCDRDGDDALIILLSLNDVMISSHEFFFYRVI